MAEGGERGGLKANLERSNPTQRSAATGCRATLSAYLAHPAAEVRDRGTPAWKASRRKAWLEQGFTAGAGRSNSGL
jgi:hypothetical protein